MKKYLLALVLMASPAFAQNFYHISKVGNIQDESGKYIAWKGSNPGIGFVSADNSWETYDPREHKPIKR